jgi:hypothetical protein
LLRFVDVLAQERERFDHAVPCRDGFPDRTHQVVECALTGVERVDHSVRLDGARQPQGEMAHTRTQVAHAHAGPDLKDGDDRLRVVQPILARAAGVQPAAHRSWQPIEHQASDGFSTARSAASRV